VSRRSGLPLRPGRQRERQRRDQTPVGDGGHSWLAVFTADRVSGRHYADFTVERTAMMRAIAEAAPVPLHARGADVPPGVEAALAKALRKAPRLRHGSVADLATALRRAVGESPARQGAPGIAARTRDLAARTFALVAPDGALLRDAALRAPTASVNYGAAGIAYAWYRRALDEGSARAPRRRGRLVPGCSAAHRRGRRPGVVRARHRDRAAGGRRVQASGASKKLDRFRP
jgi:hypothetical protein